LKRVADESGGGREVVPAAMVWSIEGGAGGELPGRLDEAAAKALRRRVRVILLLSISRARATTPRPAVSIRRRRRGAIG
jgi:hypothetical protein